MANSISDIHIKGGNMKLECGDKILVDAEVEALRLGLNSKKEVRVNVGGVSLWVSVDAIHGHGTGLTASEKDYIVDELKKRLAITSID